VTRPDKLSIVCNGTSEPWSNDRWCRHLAKRSVVVNVAPQSNARW